MFELKMALICFGVGIILYIISNKLGEKYGFDEHPFRKNQLSSEEIEEMTSEMIGKSKSECRKILKRHTRFRWK